MSPLPQRPEEEGSESITTREAADITERPWLLMCEGGSVEGCREEGGTVLCPPSATALPSERLYISLICETAQQSANRLLCSLSDGPT